MTQIFVSYAHADHDLLERFLANLRPVILRIELDLWWDDDLKAGQKWDARIRAAVDASDIFVCFVTNDFLASNYIMREELPAIRAAEKSRGALVLPVIVKKSHWTDHFGETQAVPKTKNKALRPIANWNPRDDGFHEATVQLKHGIIEFENTRPKIPDPGPGPAMVPTPAGFALKGSIPSEAEREDPDLRAHHDALRDALDELKPYVDRIGNVDPKLARAIAKYDAVVGPDFSALHIDKMWSIGAQLCERIEVADANALVETLDRRAVNDILSDLNRIHNEHAALILGTEQGRALTARVLAYRSAAQPLARIEKSAAAVLRPMTAQRDLLEPQTRAFVEDVTRPVQDGTERVDEIEAALRTAVHAIIAFGVSLDGVLKNRPNRKVDPAFIESMFADDPNLGAIQAAFRFLNRHRTAVEDFARSNPDIRRYMEQLTGALNGEKRKVLRDPIEPPDDFDLAQVHEMILRGETPPREWIPYIVELDLGGEASFVDIASLAALSNLRTLHLEGTTIVDVASIAVLTKLKTLNLAYTPVRDLTPLTALTSLENLELAGTQVKNLIPLAALTSLETLGLSDTKVADVSPLAALTSLYRIDLSDTQVADVAPLAPLASLWMLDLYNTPIVNIQPLAALANLKSLFLSSTAVADIAPLAALTNLRTLLLSDTQVASIAPLASLANLESLFLANTQVADIAPLAALANLRTLTLSQTPVADVAPLAALAKLETLTLKGTPVTNVASLVALAEMKELDLSYTSVVDVAPLAALANIRTLQLAHTPVTDISPLGRNIRLQNLNLCGTKIKSLPNQWPAMDQLNLFEATWPDGQSFPIVPWCIRPDGSMWVVPDQDTPYPFHFWQDEVKRTLAERSTSPDEPPDPPVDFYA